MAKFEFRLEPLRKLRENRLRVARRELADLQAKAVRLGADLRRCVDSGREALENSAVAVNGTDLMGVGEIARLAQSRSDYLRRELAFAEEELERQRRWVAHLGQELKAVEKLEERKREAHRQAEVLSEKRQSDRWAAENWGRLQALRAGGEGEP